ncbi:MAG: hypothetical protein RR330_05425 [Alistipes sp.]
MSIPSNNRNRVSIPITGIDTSTPDGIVSDGKCEILHNLRYAGSAWRNVNPLKIKHQSTNRNYEILYHHPTADHSVFGDIYIAATYRVDGTMDLKQVLFEGSELRVLQEGNRITLNIGVVNGNKWVEALAVRPVYSNVTISVVGSGGTRLELTIPKGKVAVGARIQETQARIDSVLPIKDARYTYVFSEREINYIAPINFSPDGEPFFKITSTAPVASDLTIVGMYQPWPREEPQFRDYSVVIPKGKSESVAFSGSDGYISKLTPVEDFAYKYTRDAPASIISTTPGDFATGIPTDCTLTHFGNVLMIKCADQIDYYIYSTLKSTYSLFKLPAPPSVKFSVDRSTLFPWEPISLPGFSYDVLASPLYSSLSGTYSLVNNGKYWSGEICLFVAYRMTDGSVVSPSELMLIASELDYPSIEDRAFSTSANASLEHRELNQIVYMQSPNHTGKYKHEHQVYIIAPSGSLTHWHNEGVFDITVLPTLIIQIPANLNLDLIDSVSIYSTRINPIFDSKKMQDLCDEADDHNITNGGRDPEYTSWLEKYDFRKIFADNKLAEQPFYLVKDIPIKELSKNNHVELDYFSLKNIDGNERYAASMGSHQMSYAGVKEYNNRAHFFNLKTRLFPGFYAIYGCLPEDTSVFTFLKIADINYVVKINRQFEEKCSKILSYPDARASEMQIFEKDNPSFLFRAALTKAQALNYAYGTRFKEDIAEINGPKYYYVKYPTYWRLKSKSKDNRDIPTINDVLLERNRIQVSGLQNPFVLPFENSYQIGGQDNKIIAINSSAVEMSDTKFGEFPLCVFTSEGIYAMQSGRGEVLYATTIPLNQDQITNSNTLTVNHNIIYITPRGIHTLYSNQSKLISEHINDRDNQPPSHYIESAQLFYQPKFNEIIVWNNQSEHNKPKYDYAFVYALDGGYWSTRSFSGRRLNNDEIIENKATIISELAYEGARADLPLTIHLKSRPIKFGSMEFKRLETLIPRIVSTRNQCINLKIEGSVDKENWLMLRTENLRIDSDITLRRFPLSLRYLRVDMTVSLTDDFEISNFDAEYYLRFVHRLR